MRLCLMLLAILSPTSTGFNSNWMSLRRYDRHSALVNARRRRQEVLEASFLPRPRTGSRDEGDIDVVSPRLLNGPQPSEAGQGVVHPSSDFRSRGAIGEQALFRHRFLCSSDMCIRMPVEGSELLRAFVMHSHLAGVIHLQVEAFRPLSRVRWSPEAERMLSIPNAGGSSAVSEALAFELLARSFGASLEKTETELDYAQGSTMTDFAITCFGGFPVGVSVTRAYKWRGSGADDDDDDVRGVPGHAPFDNRFRSLSVTEAHRLLAKKLAGINASSRNVQNYRWHKQLLLVLAFTHRDAVLIEKVYRQQVSADLRANTILVITRCDGVRWVQ